MAEYKPIATNRKAYHDYEIGDTFEAGLVLMGSEVKSLRSGQCNMQDGFVEDRDGELWMLQVHISEYAQANIWGHEPLRPRKLLLHKQEIARLIARKREKGFTLVPTKMYFKDGRAKVEVALARGRNKGDKRQAMAEKDARRDIQRALKDLDR